MACITVSLLGTHIAPLPTTAGQHHTQVDRFDARLLLHKVPSKPQAPRAPSPANMDDDIDALRYADLHAPLPPDDPPLPQQYAPAYTAAAYSYDAPPEDEAPHVQHQDDAAAAVPSAAAVEDAPFMPLFPVPESLCDALPATRKQHKVCSCFIYTLND